MLEYCTEFWFEIDVMLDGGDLSQAPVSHLRELEQRAHDVHPHGFFLAARVDILLPLF